jgi:precorrin-8X/cobalt-precorrin-8 methylmutase
VVHTTAEPEFAKLLVISDKAVKAGVDAVKAGAKIVTDVKMVKAGISEARVKRFGGKTLTYIDDPQTVKLAEKEGISRSAAAIRLAVNDGVDGAIILIGNAPTAAFELADAVKKGQAKPALIVATPVGYIGAAESKELIATLPVPFIILRTRKGGSAVAVAIFNALLAMAEGKTSSTQP